jgi:hypothetical protein
VAVYDRKSRTPFTGLVPAYLAEKISASSGVLASSPEAIASCIVKDESPFLRGIRPGDFTKLNQITIINGDMLKLDDLNSAVVGGNAAWRLGTLGSGRFKSSILEGVSVERRNRSQVAFA